MVVNNRSSDAIIPMHRSSLVMAKGAVKKSPGGLACPLRAMSMLMVKAMFMITFRVVVLVNGHSTH